MIRPEPDSSPLSRVSLRKEDEYFTRKDQKELEDYRAAVAELRRQGRIRPDQTVRDYINERLREIGLLPSEGFIPDDQPLDLDPKIGGAIDEFFKGGVYRDLTGEEYTDDE